MRTHRTTPKKSAVPQHTKNGTPERPEILTLDETATYLRVPAEVVLRMIRAEGLPARKFDTEWRFFRAAIQD